MKIILLFFIALTSPPFLWAQEEECIKIIFNDSLFNLQGSKYSFNIKEGMGVHGIKKENIEDLNDIIRIDDDCLSFIIGYGCGCGPNEKKLLTNGRIYQDHENNNYYYIKLLFTNHNQGCAALCREKLFFDISALKNPQSIIYLRFVGFDQLLKYK